MNITLGKLGMGGRMGLGSGGSRSGFDWRTEPDLKRVCAFSPQIALARYYNLDFAPAVQTIVATFTNTVDAIGPFALGVNNGNDRLSIITVIDQMMLQVDAPNYNDGNAMKGLLDFFWARQTGVNATMLIDGSPRFAVATDPVPVAHLVDMFTEMWPDGWVLNSTQIPKMSFETSFALPSVPVTFTIGFRMWQPENIQRMTGLTDAQAVRILVECNVLCEDDATRWCTT